jgi:hypothetical protein
MRFSPFVAAAAALLVTAAPAFAGDPIMPLSDVHAGMQCTAYSVVRGTDVTSFDVEVLDVVDGDATYTPDGARILIQVSGPAVDATGIGPGFSGSPIYCPDAAGVSRNIGAISESIGEYGGKVVLATPIEAILGTPVDAPGKDAPPATAPAAATRVHGLGAGERDAAAAARALTARERWERDLLARAKPLAAPLTVSGLSTSVTETLAAAATKAGRMLIAAPAGPLASYPKQVLRPGSAVAAGYSSGDIRFGAVGTVAYTDGDKVWAFGHPFEDNGARALLLQDAYVFRVVDNPLQTGSAATYKLSVPGHDLGTVSDDATNAIAGRVGALPHTVPVSALARDVDNHIDRTVNVRVADEQAVDLPSGGSWLTSIAPVAVIQAATNVLGSTPGRATGDMCARIKLAELKQPLRFCNRYVSLAQEQAEDGSLGNAVTTGAASDLATALSSIDSYTGKPPRVTGVSVELKLHRAADQAFIRHVHVPTSVRPGEKLRVTLTLQRVRGAAEFKRGYTLRIPRDARPGVHKLQLIGRDADSSDDSLATTIILGDDSQDDGGGDPGPTSLASLRDQVEGLARYDGVTLRLGSSRARAFRDDALRISGRGSVMVRVVR